MSKENDEKIDMDLLPLHFDSYKSKEVVGASCILNDPKGLKPLFACHL